MTMVQIFTVALFVCCFGSFTWALQGGFFVSDGEKNVGITLTRVLGLTFLLIQIWTFVYVLPPPPLASVVGSGLYGLALLLFWSALYANWRRPLALAFTTQSPHHLTATGPYRLVRHPFYTSYLLGWAAGFVATCSLLTLPAVLVMGTLYLMAARREEHLFAQSSLASSYASYKLETGMFLPKLRQLSLQKSNLSQSPSQKEKR